MSQEDLKQRIRSSLGGLRDTLLRADGLTPRQKGAIAQTLSQLSSAADDLVRRHRDLAARLGAEGSQPCHARPLESASHGCIVTDADGVVIEAGAVAAGMLAATTADIAGKSLALFLTEEHRTALDARLEGIRAAEAVDAWRPLMRPLRGAPFSADVTPVLRSGTRVLWIIRAIDGNDKAAGRLHRTNDFSEHLLSSARLAVAYMDDRFDFIRVNRAYAAACGRVSAFFRGRNYFALYPSAEVEEIFRGVVETGRPFAANAQPFVFSADPGADAPSGAAYWDWSLEPVKDPSGKVSGVVLLLHDVTRQRLAAAALEESERKYRMLIEQASDAMFTVDPATGRILEANSRAAELTGYAMEELGRLRMEDLVPGESLRRGPLRGERLLEGETLIAERPLLRKDGKTITVEETSRLLPDGRVQLTSRDVTERRRAQEQALLYQQRLRLATARLALAEEDERRRIAKEIHDQVGQTLAICQIRLGALVEEAGQTSLTGPLNEIRNYISLIIKYTRSLTFELGSPILYELGLEAAIDELVRAMPAQYRIEGSFEDDGRPKPLSAEMRVVVFQAVREMLANAGKHSRAQRVSVSVSAEGACVVVRVKDSGAGFDVAEAESRVQGGGGFGLFSTRERLECMGGSLRIESRRGEGTCVTIRAPLIAQ